APGPHRRRGGNGGRGHRPGGCAVGRLPVLGGGGHLPPSVPAGADVAEDGRMSTSRPEETPSRARLDASMTLLNEVRRRPLDPGYAAAARARAQGRAKPRTIAGRVLIFLLAVALGLTGGWAARELRIPAEDVPSASSGLAEELRRRSQVNDQLADEGEDLQEQIAAMQAQQLGSEADSILTGARNQAVWAGTVAVHGPGVTVTLRASERAQRNSPGSEEERVQDSDLQVVVNGLWQPAPRRS